MIRSIITLFLMTFLLVGNESSGQTDTIVSGIKYNYVDHYSNGKIKSLGNYSHKLKTGNWIYFKQNGDNLAKGKFIKGHKIKKWYYFDYEGNTNEIEWRRKQFLKEELVILNGQFFIRDYWTNGRGYQIIYLNGKQVERGEKF